MIKRFFKFYNHFVKPKIITYENVRLKLDNKLVSEHIKKIVYNYAYEKSEIIILKKVLEKSDIVMEVGAGMGFLSIYCSKFIDNGKVIAYEANPNLITLIEQNYQLNGVNPIIKNFILSNKRGKIEFYIENNFYSSSTIKRSDKSNMVTVDTEDINHEIAIHKPSLLIVDIEGGEKELIQKINFKENTILKLLLELHPHIIGEEETNKIIKFLFESDFLLDTAKSGNYVYYFYRDVK